MKFVAVIVAVKTRIPPDHKSREGLIFVNDTMSEISRQESESFSGNFESNAGFVKNFCEFSV